MSYTLRYSKQAIKELKKLDPYTQKIIKGWIEKNLLDCENPRAHGKSLTANRSGQWRYRIGDYRLICHIDDDPRSKRRPPPSRLYTIASIYNGKKNPVLHIISKTPANIIFAK